MPPITPYQVRPLDRDLMTLAARLETPYQILKNLNPNISSISTGQYINLPKPPPTLPGITPKVKPPTMGPTPPSLAGMGGLPTPGPRPPTSSPYSLAGMGGLPTPGPRPPAASSSAIIPRQGLPGMGGFYSMGLGQEQRIKENLLRMTTATSQEMYPPVVPLADISQMGVTPAQMVQAGYILSGGNWIQPGGITPAATGAAGTAATTPQTQNNWETNPALRLITLNRNAKNKRNRYVTTLKHAQTMWRHAKQRAKGIERTNLQPTAEILPIRADAPSTTLDLILGA